MRRTRLQYPLGPTQAVTSQKTIRLGSAVVNNSWSKIIVGSQVAAFGQGSSRPGLVSLVLWPQSVAVHDHTNPTHPEVRKLICLFVHLRRAQVPPSAQEDVVARGRSFGMENVL